MLITHTITVVLICVTTLVGIGIIMFVKKKYPRGLGLRTVVTLGVMTGVTVVFIYITSGGKHVWVVEKDSQGVVVAKEYRLFSSARYKFDNGSEILVSDTGGNRDHTLVVNNSAKTIHIKELAGTSGNAPEPYRGVVLPDEISPMSIFKSDVHINYVDDDKHAPPKGFSSQDGKPKRYLLTWK